MKGAKQWWWVFSFCLVTLFVYGQSMKRKKEEMNEYLFRIEDFKEKKRDLIREKEELDLQIASHKDPAWIEMVLMRDLGMVPEGWLKVHFVNSP